LYFALNGQCKNNDLKYLCTESSIDDEIITDFVFRFTGYVYWQTFDVSKKHIVI